MTLMKVLECRLRDLGSSRGSSLLAQVTLLITSVRMPWVHTPYMYLPSGQSTLPRPCLNGGEKYLRSLKKWPSQTQRLLQMYFPVPCFLSRRNYPMQSSQFYGPDCHLPSPYLKPALKLPRQKERLYHRYLPYPWNLPLEQKPMYLSPFLNSYIPKPSLISLLNIPQQMPVYDQKWPFPCLWSHFHSPQQKTLSLRSRNLPMPCFSPSTHSPSQRIPSLTKDPTPLRLLSLKSPSQQCLSFENSFPKPFFSFLAVFHSPMYSLPLQYHTIFMSGNRFSSNMMQFLYFLRMQSSRSQG